MEFKLREDTRKWFKDIAKHYPLDFDLYYLCLMVGFASLRRNTDIKPDQTKDFIGYFPGEFKSRGRLLVGVLINTELSRLGIDLEERNDVYGRVAELVDPNSPSYLSNKGMQLMNEYAYGGFDVLCEYFSDRPRSIETFTRQYFHCISNLKGN